MTTTPVPILDEDGRRLDWLTASYSADVRLTARQAVVTHSLNNAPQLDQLVRQGTAKWTVELRCPRTLLSVAYYSEQRESTIALDDNHIKSEAFIIPGLVAIKPTQLDTCGLHPSRWEHGVPVSIPQGWWLVRGDVRRTNSLIASFIRFKRDPDGRLKDGQMSVEEDSDGLYPCFVITLAADLYNNRRYNRDIQIAGLIAACGLLPNSSLGLDRDNEDHPIAQELRNRLEMAGVDPWDSPTFDPARAATAIEAFVGALRYDPEDH